MAFLLAWRQFKSHWAAGELRVLMLALVLAVAATSAVGFFTDRVSSTLNRQGGLLLGGDLVLTANHALPEDFGQKAQAMGLKTASTMEFPSMVLFGELSQLAEIKVLSNHFPLVGDFTVSSAVNKEVLVKHPPGPGTIWVEPRLAHLLGVKVGDRLQVGEIHLKVAAILVRETSRGGDMFSFAPRVMMNVADIEATQLIQYGSRVKYQFLMTGTTSQLAQYLAWAEPKLKNGERIEDVRSARPEVRSALDKSQQFLGLSAMVSVILSIVAMFLASIPYVQSSANTFALMRCFGASSPLITRVLLAETAYIALIGGLLGCLIGFFAQMGLISLLGGLLIEDIPPLSLSSMTLKPLQLGMLVSFATMLAVIWPHLSELSHVPALRILRNDIDKKTSSWLRYAPLLAVLAGMVYWYADNIKLATATLLSFVVLFSVISILAWLLLTVLKRLPDGSSSIWKLGVAGLKRRPTLAVAQCVGLSLGLMALMLLAFMRADLMQNWKDSLPADAPNRFVINIQPEQIKSVNEFFKQASIEQAQVFPMIRGRLVEVNGQPFEAKQFQDERARKLAEREFNLSVAAHMQADNTLVAGRWWLENEGAQPYVSLEQGLADTLHLKLGDMLTYDIAGTRIALKVTSLRKVEWDTMRANFFAVTPPKTLDKFSASYMSAFYLPSSQTLLIEKLVKAHPNFTVIDVAALLQQVRDIMNKVSSAIQYVFVFSVLAGVAVLYAALVATRDERIREATLLRVLGASRKQVTLASLAEFFCIGLLASMVATMAATALAYYVSVEVLNIHYQFNFSHALIAVTSASLLVPVAAWLVIRNYLNQPPRQLLHSS